MTTRRPRPEPTTPVEMTARDLRWAIKELTNVVRPDDPLLVRYREALERMEKANVRR